MTIQMKDNNIAGIASQLISGTINVNQSEAFAAKGITLTLTGTEDVFFRRRYRRNKSTTYRNHTGR